jgi:flagellar hook assembly protein FlgD
VAIDPADGSAPYTLSGSGSVSHVYGVAGTYQAVVTVTDSVGESLTVRSPLVDVRVGPPLSPTAVASASPTFGSAPLNVSLSAAGSSDVDGTIVLYEWDFDFDSVFAADWSSPTTGSTSHSYTAAGQHIAALRVTDNDGMSAIDVAAVTVDINVGLSVSDDTFNPHDGESSPVNTSQSAGADVDVYIQSRSGNRVRTLFNGYRGSGNYSDNWDGRDDGGNIVPDADYYAYIDYQVGSVTKTKPDTASGGSFGWVSGTQNISGFGSFNPWADEFWELTFDTTRSSMGASEVTLWITMYISGIITDTPYNREVFGTGQYKCWWDGITDEGKYVAAADRDGYGFLWSAQAWRLPDNTIVVEGGKPWITDPSANPNQFWPATTLCLGAEKCDIQFTIDTKVLSSGGSALNATASASSSYSSYYTPSNMLDGNTSTYWYSSYGMPQWIQLDFPQTVSLDGIHLDHFNQSYSPDGVDIILSNGYSQQTVVNRADDVQINIPQQTGIDWIRVQTTGSTYSNYWIIRELQVDGQIEAPGSSPGLATMTLKVFKMANGNLLNSITTGLLPAGTHTISWDGKTASGDEYVAPGSYRLELTAQTPNGDVSFLRRVLVEVKY